LFDEKDDNYLLLATSSAKALAEQNTFIEVNTGAIARGYRDSFYPAKNLLPIFGSSDKPFVVSSDAHTLEGLVFGLAEATNELEKLGYKTVKTLSEIL
jgi:histidinol-phosphatase (PHP family)